MSTVVVGVDDSEDALRAVEWAAAEAERRKQTLEILHAFIWPLLGVPLGPAPGAPPEGGFRHAAERILATAVAHARKVAPDIEVTTSLPEAGAVPALLRRAHRAGLLVVGNRGLGEVGGLVLNSVGARLGAEAACPVVVVRGSVTPQGPVMVGIADPDESEALLTFAFAHAVRTTNALTLAHAGAGPSMPEHDLAPWRARFPSVTIDQEALAGRPGRALAHPATLASLLVVGSHHRHGLRALLHGSVSQAVLHHASCPVAIIRMPR
ncbi:universal stress protein [Streptosporangium sp. G11]|uniref:universal stress protein n=1 Tax=Streptosporangium sp. G11 TaxID=3436926 RepID=UPI003EB713D1